MSQERKETMKKKIKKESALDRVQKMMKKKEKENEVLSSMLYFFLECLDRDANFAQFADDLICKDARRLGGEDAFVEIVTPLLSMGFLIGQLFEVTAPEMRKQIESMRQLITGKGLLSCVPRNKAA